MTIEPKTVEALDRLVKARGLPSRSKALEVALAYWLTQQRRLQVEQEIESYYRSRSAKEEREDREWATFASREASRLKE
jgi:metal-responsive CopG/Arc/MetJ family transcriptional regulator